MRNMGFFADMDKDDWAGIVSVLGVVAVIVAIVVAPELVMPLLVPTAAGLGFRARASL